MKAEPQLRFCSSGPLWPSQEPIRTPTHFRITPGTQEGFPWIQDPAKGPRKENNLEIAGSEAKSKAGKM